MKARLSFLSSMIIFGAVGVFAKFIPLPPAKIAWFLSLIGALSLSAVFLWTTKKVDWSAVKSNLLLLCIASAALSGNWIFLFQAYKETSIANAALSYYSAPIMVILLAPFFLPEKLSRRKLLCAAVALFGLFLLLQNSTGGSAENSASGMRCGCTAAVFYAALTLINKFIHGPDNLTTTLFQLGLATIFLTFYDIFTDLPLTALSLTTSDILLLLLLGAGHGGLGFYLFFYGMKDLDGQSIAVLSYADPLTSLLFSVCLMNDPLTLQQIAGALCLFGSIWFAEKHAAPAAVQKQDLPLPGSPTEH